MKNITIISVFIFIISVPGYSQDTTGTGKIIKDFYSHLLNFEYDKAVELMDTSIIRTAGKETISKTLGYRQQMFGTVNSYSQYQSSVITKDGLSYQSFRYRSECVKGTAYDRFDLIKRGDEYKILNYRYGNKDISIDKN